MRPTRIAAYAVAAIVLSLGSTSLAAVMDFDSLELGTVFGSTALPVPHTPGEVVFSQDGIDMSVENFFYDGLSGCVEAEVGGRFNVPNKPLELNNISVRFDFTKLGIDVNLVTIEFTEFGPQNNLAANDSAVHELFSLTEIDGGIVSLSPRVTAAVDNGLLTLTGDLDSILIGGQELVIDNITAVPEPATLALLSLAGGMALLRRRFPRR